MQKKFENIVKHQAYSVKRYVDTKIGELTGTEVTKIQEMKEAFAALNSELKGNSKEDKAVRTLIEKIGTSDKLQSSEIDQIKQFIVKLEQQTIDCSNETKDLLQKIQALQDFLFFDDDQLCLDFDSILFGTEADLKKHASEHSAEHKGL